MAENGSSIPCVAETSIWSIRPRSAARSLLLLTLLLLPLHTQVFYYLVPWATGIPQILMSVWKELTLLAAGAILVFYHVMKGHTVSVLFCDLVAFLFICYLLCLFLLAPDKGLAAYALRVYAEPIFVYYLARSVDLSYPRVERFFGYLFGLAVLISVWAIFQAAVLGDSFLINLGYKTLPSGKLATGFYIALFFFQRAVGTFASPNTFAIFLQMVIPLGVFLRYRRVVKSRKLFWVLLSPVIGAQLYSFSRSAWLATLASLGLFMFLFFDWRRFLRIGMKLFFCSLLAMTLVSAIKPDLVVPVVTHLENTLTLKDPSTVGHIESLRESLKIVSRDPLGIGLGLSGPRAIGRSDQAVNSENSFFVLAFDVGIPGVLLYGVFLLAVISRLMAAVHGQPDSPGRGLILTTVAIFFGQMISWNLLPYNIELETTILLFALLGIAHNLARKMGLAGYAEQPSALKNSEVDHARA